MGEELGRELLYTWDSNQLLLREVELKNKTLIRRPITVEDLSIIDTKTS